MATTVITPTPPSNKGIVINAGFANSSNVGGTVTLYGPAPAGVYAIVQVSISCVGSAGNVCNLLIGGQIVYTFDGSSGFTGLGTAPGYRPSTNTLPITQPSSYLQFFVGPGQSFQYTSPATGTYTVRIAGVEFANSLNGA